MPKDPTFQSVIWQVSREKPLVEGSNLRAWKLPGRWGNGMTREREKEERMEDGDDERDGRRGRNKGSKKRGKWRERRREEGREEK